MDWKDALIRYARNAMNKIWWTAQFAASLVMKIARYPR